MTGPGEDNKRPAAHEPVDQSAPEQPSTEVPDYYPAKGELIVCTADFVFVRQGYHYVWFQPADLLFLQADGNYTDIVTSGHKYALRLVLGRVLGHFSPANLVRVHRCYAVNRHHIDSLGDGSVMLGSHTIPVGRTYRDALLSHFRRL